VEKKASKISLQKAMALTAYIRKALPDFGSYSTEMP
jgi:hypothetical protein